MECLIGFPTTLKRVTFLDLASWDLRSRGVVLWKVGAAEITEFRDNLLQAS